MKKSQTVLSLAVASALAAFAGGAQASGFALIEQNASGMGNAFAGAAAAATDASTIYFNPAGMTRLPGRQFVISGHAIRPSAEFSNTTSTLAPLQTSLGDNGGDAGDWAFVPNAYLSWQIDPKWFVGVGLNAPFGLKTEYTPTWAGRFFAVESEVKTINVNPSVAYKVNDTVSLGAGISWQRVDATLSNSVNYSAAAFAVGGLPAVAAVGGAGREGIATVTGDDSAWGFNLGAMFNVNPNTRVGLTYRSAINYTISGTAAFANRPAALAAGLPDGGVTANLKMPASASLSLFHQLNPKWDLLGDISWTGWSSVQTLNIVRTSGTLLTTTPLYWSDTWRLSGGANYHMNDAWTLRMGIAYDQSPVPDAFRTPRIPDNDRTWLAVGGQYRFSKQSALDFGYAYLFVKDSGVNLCNAAQAAAIPAACSGKNNLVGNYKNDVNILSAQFRYTF
jgi:long-chain fatty acid transport protein